MQECAPDASSFPEKTLVARKAMFALAPDAVQESTDSHEALAPPDHVTTVPISEHEFIKDGSARVEVMNKSLVLTHSPLRCPQCKYHYTLRQEGDLLAGVQVKCSVRAHAHDDVMNARWSIHPDSADALDVDRARKMTWYHASTDHQWLDSVLSSQNAPLVHVGTEEAAKIRCIESSMRQQNSSSWRLYAVKLDSSTVFAPDIEVDKNAWPTHVDEITGRQTHADAHRYVNFWESPGSISLLLDPRKISSIECIFVNPSSHLPDDVLDGEKKR